LWPDGIPLKAELVAIGRIGVIIKHGGRAFKISRRDDILTCAESKREYLISAAEISHESLEREKSVYRHLNRYDGIVECFKICNAGIEMALLQNGNLADYIQRKPNKSLQFAWIYQMTGTIRYVHRKHVIIADVVTRNFLVADDLSIKLSNFTESTIMPLDVNMDEADDFGYSVQTDIGQFKTVIYKIVIKKSFIFDLFQG
jgi:serine/threonine protein kinase